MKELSIEQKAKAYDEALKVLHKYDGANIMFTQDLKEEMFPELKEDEDEKIRKDLITFLDEIWHLGKNGNFDKWDKCDCSNWIAWLEKQGEKKPQGKSALEPIKEENVDNANKVESTFKVGDWIVYNDAVWKVCNISLQNYYELLKINNEVNTRLIKDVDENAHLWDIAKDAKEGDVLTVGWWKDKDFWQKIIIFKKYHSEGIKWFNMPCVEGYGNTFKNGKLALNEEVPYFSKTWTSNLHPATKEQRDLLFTKMKEVGYEWVNNCLSKIY